MDIRSLPTELEESFRDLVIKNFGHRKGNVSKALTEALEFYVFNQDGFKKWKMDRKIIERALKSSGFST